MEGYNMLHNKFNEVKTQRKVYTTATTKKEEIRAARKRLRKQIRIALKQHDYDTVFDRVSTGYID